LPKIRKNVIKKALTEIEREEFFAVGYTEPEIDKLEEELKAPSWDFWSKASELYLSLSAGSDVVFTSGKMRSVDSVSSAKFSSNCFSTADRQIARLIFMSDPYRAGKIKLAKDQTEYEAQEAYKEFKTKILSSKENVEKLKRDLAIA